MATPEHLQGHATLPPQAPLLQIDPLPRTNDRWHNGSGPRYTGAFQESYPEVRHDVV